MEAIIVYANKKNHAKKTALALGKMLNLPVAHVSEKPDLSKIDCLCLVGELSNGEALPDMVTYVSGLRTGEVRMAALITCSAHTDSSQAMVQTLLRHKEIDVNGESICLSQEMLIFSPGHPNKSDFERCAKYLRGILGMSKFT